MFSHAGFSLAPRLGRALRLGAVGCVVAVAPVLAAGCGGGGDEQEELTQPERVAKAKKGVVSITGKAPQVDPQTGVKGTIESGGTGVVIDPRQGLVLTNAHVVTGLTAIKVKVGQSESPARVEAQAPCQDLALIRMTTPPPGLTAMPFANSDRIKAGEHITAVGYPGDIGEGDFAERKYSATEGTISVPRTKFAGAADIPALPNVLRHQVPTSGGNSGGPLIDDQVRVVGIITLGLSSQEANVQQQNLAISSNQVRQILPQLRRKESEGYVGWNLQTVDTRAGELLQIVGVDAGSPAQEGNFRPGDFVQEIDGQPVKTPAEACEVLQSRQPGASLRVSGIEISPATGRYQTYTNAKLKVAKSD